MTMLESVRMLPYEPSSTRSENPVIIRPSRARSGRVASPTRGSTKKSPPATRNTARDATLASDDQVARGDPAGPGGRPDGRLARHVLEERDPAQQADETDEREEEPHAERRPRGGDEHEEREEGDRP